MGAAAEKDKTAPKKEHDQGRKERKGKCVVDDKIKPSAGVVAGEIALVEKKGQEGKGGQRSDPSGKTAQTHPKEGALCLPEAKTHPCQQKDRGDQHYELCIAGEPANIGIAQPSRQIADDKKQAG